METVIFHDEELNEDLEIDKGEFCIEDNGKTRKRQMRIMW